MEYWIWLSSVPYIGPVTSRRLVQEFGDPETVYRSGASDLCQIKGITQRQIVSLIENKSLDRVYKIMQDCEKHNISILTQNNPEYPERAKEPEDSPIILYYKGCIQNQNMKKTVGIVGPRRCTQEEKHKVVEITEQVETD